MRKDTCGQLVIQVPLYHCRTTALCNEKCSDDRNFVCGSDNKIYRSECEMKRNNCGYVYIPFNSRLHYTKHKCIKVEQWFYKYAEKHILEFLKI